MKWIALLLFILVAIGLSLAVRKDRRVVLAAAFLLGFSLWRVIERGASGRNAIWRRAGVRTTPSPVCTGSERSRVRSRVA